MRSEWPSFPLLATMTFLDAQQDITYPEAAVLVAGQTTERRCSVRQQPVEDLSGHDHQVTRRSPPNPGSMAVPYVFGLVTQRSRWSQRVSCAAEGCPSQCSASYPVSRETQRLSSDGKVTSWRMS
jgi:hypothetical protein